MRFAFLGIASRLAALSAAAVLLACASSTGAQGEAKPAPELKRLEFMLGKSTGKGNFNFPGMEKGKWSSRDDGKWIKGGMFLQSDSQMEFGEQIKEDSTEFWSYDAANKQYRVWRFTSMDPQPIEAVGNFEGSKLVMITKPDASGMTLRLTWEPKGKEVAFLLEVKVGEKFEPMMDGTLSPVKAPIK